jgi:hypothetical protein
MKPKISNRTPPKIASAKLKAAATKPARQPPKAKALLLILEDELIPIPSSPPIVEPAPRHEPQPEPEEDAPLFGMEMAYVLRVNGLKVIDDSADLHSSFFMLSMVKDRFMALIGKPASTIEEQPYR